MQSHQPFTETTTEQKLHSLLEGFRKDFIFSAFQVSFGDLSKAYNLSGGKTSYWPNAQSIDDSTWFDIGSMTKVVCTTSIVARLVQQGKIDLNRRLDYWMPELKPLWIGERPLIELLSHCAGLKGWLPLYQELKEGENFLSWFLRNAELCREYRPREKTVYSDIGFLLVGEVLERCEGSLKELFQREVVTPLRLEEVGWGPMESNNVVATEYCEFRKRLLIGEVFDENSFKLGGITAHAGLFATTRGLVPWCRAWLLAKKGKSEWLNQATAQLFTKRLEFLPGSDWAIGWDMVSKGRSSSGKYFSEQSFGHLGYPGTSVWIDPVGEMFTLFFTNRIHPTRKDGRIQMVRPVVHDAILEAWKKEGRV